MQLTKEQKSVITELIKCKKQVQTLGGLAGTGKSVVVQHLSLALDSFATIAYTGKAADVLRKKGVEQAQTIHSTIYIPLRDEKGNMVLDKHGNPTFVLDYDIGVRGFIIDEASMVPGDIYQDLLSFNVPLIFVGDHGQLEPIKSDFNLMQEPDFRLEEIHRNAGEIAHFCQHIRLGNKPTSFPSEKKVKFITKWQAENYYQDVDQIICAYNKSRARINRTYRKMLDRDPDWPVVGDRVMCLKNNKKAGLFNGMQGVVKSLDPKVRNKMVFGTDTGDFTVLFDPEQLNQEKYEIGFGKEDPEAFDFCNGITCHKAQGSEWNRGLVIEEKCDLWDHRRWAYTSGSRFRKTLIWAS